MNDYVSSNKVWSYIDIKFVQLIRNLRTILYKDNIFEQTEQNDILNEERLLIMLNNCMNMHRNEMDGSDKLNAELNEMRNKCKDKKVNKNMSKKVNKNISEKLIENMNKPLSEKDKKKEMIVSNIREDSSDESDESNCLPPLESQAAEFEENNDKIEILVRELETYYGLKDYKQNCMEWHMMDNTNAYDLLQTKLHGIKR